MPIYDYRCAGCGAEFEALVRGAAAPVCPSCGSAEPERLPSFLTAVRSDATRDVVSRETRRRDAAQARERVHEQARYERNHD
jgi:putative FmdB family regulatory protein